MWRKITIALLTVVIFVSCARNANTVKDNDTPNKKSSTNQASTGLVYQSEEERIRDLLHAQSELATEWNESVLSLKKVNFCISGGDNWLIEWGYNTEGEYYTGLMAYLIDDYSIKKGYDLGLNYNKDSERIKSQFDIMKNIPGTHIGNGCSSIWDFNSDGVDEVFKYAFGGMGNFIVIKGYDSATDDFPNYCYIPFDIIDPENGPAPVEFMTYKGMDGFKVYYVELSVAGGPGYVPEPIPDNRKWFFYTWDAEKREYVRVEEVAE